MPTSPLAPAFDQDPAEPASRPQAGSREDSAREADWRAAPEARPTLDRAPARDFGARMAALAAALFLHGGVIALAVHHRAPPIGVEPEGVEVVLESAPATPEPVVAAEPTPTEVAPTALAPAVEPPAEPIRETARAEPEAAPPAASEPEAMAPASDMAAVEPPPPPPDVAAAPAPEPPSAEPSPPVVAAAPPPAPAVVAESPAPPAVASEAAPVAAPAPPLVAAAPPVTRRPPPAAARRQETREAMRERPAPRREIARAETRSRAEPGGRPAAPPRTAARAELANAGVAERRSAGPTPTWIAAVRARIAGGQTYPEAARARGETGTVRIAMVIGRGGALAGASLAGGSGSATLDAAALALVRRVSPFPPFTADMTTSSVSIVVPIAYRLRN